MPEPTRTEQCAYYRLGTMDTECKQKNCKGINNECFKYVTLEHLQQFRELDLSSPKSKLEEI